MEDTLVQAENSNQADEAVVVESTEEVSVDSQESDTTESVEEMRERLAEEAEKRQKAETLANNYKIRAEKAEKAVKAPQEPKTEGLTSKDTIALINAKVHEEDIDEVVEYARFKKISIADALKSSVVRASLSERSEQRSTAEATNTGRTRGSARVSPEALLGKAQKTGEIPDNPAELSAMLESRYSR